MVVGTPGRICHFLEEQSLNFGDVKAFVLDEADMMLDIGYVNNFYIQKNYL